MTVPTIYDAPTFSGREPSQHPVELGWLLGVMDMLGVQKYLEVGAREGDTFHRVMKRLGANAFGMAVDMPGGAWGRSGTTAQLQRACLDLVSRGRRAHMVLGDSHGQDVLEAAAGWAPFDLVFIDGDHSHDAALADFHAYRGLTRALAFHDISGEVESDDWGPVEVPVVWVDYVVPWAKANDFLVLTCQAVVEPFWGFGIGVIVMDQAKGGTE